MLNYKEAQSLVHIGELLSESLHLKHYVSVI